jgi:RHS repeat-associated protein
VDDIDYDAKGQREQIVYGSGATTTTYAYDPLTFRMARLKTVRLGDANNNSDDVVLQNLGYTYDPAGNITEINDSAQQATFFANDVALPRMAYVYDALYRLISATGREQAGLNADVQRDQDDVPLMNLPHANDAAAVRTYAESYGYDAVGNILQMIHDGGAAATSWTRNYTIDTASNRLTATSAGAYSLTYGYDAHGNMTSMPHLPAIDWNHRDEMAHAVLLGTGGDVYFTYDAAGQRVRKVWEHAGLVEERIYLGGWEVYRRRVASTGVVTLERETLHVMDGARRIALVETKTVDADAGGAFQVATVTRFQMENHLGSAVLEVDPDGMVLSYEEYHPYGTTAYQSGTSAAEVSRKRYRYTGKERDEETGLYYHGARYYAPWLGRWTSADPAGMVDGPNAFAYAHNNPVLYFDPTGHQHKSSLPASFWWPDASQCGSAGPPNATGPTVGFRFDLSNKAIQRSGPIGNHAERSETSPTASSDVASEPPATFRQGAAAAAKGAAKGLIVGGAIEFGVGFAAGLLGVGVGVAAAPLLVAGAVVLLWNADKIEAGAKRLLSGNGTVSDWESVGEVGGGFLSGGMSGLGEGAGKYARSEVNKMIGEQAKRGLVTVGGAPIEETSAAATHQSTGGGAGASAATTKPAIGLGIKEHIGELPSSIDALYYFEWEGAGLGKWSNRTFESFFNEASSNASHIHFNLTGMKGIEGGIEPVGSEGFTTTGKVTMAELTTILRSATLRAKTTFYKNGEIVGAPTLRKPQAGP